MLIKLLQGAFIGVAMILPGLSAGTVILILGFYRRFLNDLAGLRFKPYLPIAAGAVLGGLVGIYGIGFLLEHHGLIISGFLLGMLLASIPAVFGYNRSDTIPAQVKNNPFALIFGIVGFIITWFYICEPARTFTVLPPGGYLHFFIGGTLSSATMLLPGVSGGAVLIILDLYEDAIQAVTTWQWFKLAFFSAGFIVGLLTLSRLLSALYRRYQAAVSFLLAGLILGSTRVLLPDRLSFTFLVFAAAGALAVYTLTRKTFK